LGRKKLELKSDVSSLKELAIQAGGVGRFEEAISLWNRILALDPKMADAYINLSYNHLKQQNYEEAARLSRRARELDPNSKEALLNYASAEFFNGDMERVIQSLEDSLPECSEYPPILGLLSLAYLLEGKPEKGFPLAEKLKKMGFNYSEYISRSADDLIGAGQEQRAKSLLHWMAKNRKGEGAPAGMIVG
jgi:tetratricopeptide (TPR) repeat protein